MSRAEPLKEPGGGRAMTYEQVVERYGPWSAMSIHLGGERYTLMPPRPDWRLRRLLQIVGDHADKPLERLRVLDLACLEGQYGIEFALHGAQAVGIEARETHVEKARFAKEQLGLANYQVFQDDV